MDEQLRGEKKPQIFHVVFAVRGFWFCVCHCSDRVPHVELHESLTDDGPAYGCKLVVFHGCLFHGCLFHVCVFRSNRM
jgi:hypothetical protein